MKNGIPAIESIDRIMPKAEESYSIAQSIIQDDDIGVPNEVQKKVNEDIKTFTEYSDVPQGILEYIVY